MSDLVVLVADRNMEYTIRGILARPARLGIRPIDYRIFVHPGKDGGVRTTGPATLLTERQRYDHGLLLLDWEGSGSEFDAPLALEAQLDRELGNHWGNQAKAIVIVPEVDTWMWGSDNVLRQILNWPHTQNIRPWLEAKQMRFDGNGKPLDPKKAIECVLKAVGEPRSSRLYEAIVTKISLQRCVDPAFHRFKNTLRAWFST